MLTMVLTIEQSPQPLTRETSGAPWSSELFRLLCPLGFRFWNQGCSACVSVAGGEPCRLLHVSSHLVSLCAQEPDLGLKVAEEVVAEAETGMWMESEAHVAQVAEVAQPQPLLAMASVRRESVGVEVAVLTEELQPVDQQRVLAR